MADHKLWYKMCGLLKKEGILYQTWYKEVTFYESIKNDSYVIIDRAEVEDHLINDRIEELVTNVKLQLLFTNEDGH